MSGYILCNTFFLSLCLEEMKNFARHWVDPVFQFSSLLFLVVVHTAILTGIAVGLADRSWIAGVCSGGGLVLLCYTFLVLVWYCSQRYVTCWSAFSGISRSGFILLCHNLKIKIQPLLKILDCRTIYSFLENNRGTFCLAHAVMLRVWGNTFQLTVVFQKYTHLLIFSSCIYSTEFVVPSTYWRIAASVLLCWSPLHQKYHGFNLSQKA
jgi:hypothetical protein